jgi:catechol 2,3-dioxygenase-like lactoylglutathione lyase family enzyme
MTTMADDPVTEQGAPRCGCCGRAVPVGRLVELGSTPGVFICDRCALWAARRSTRMPVLSLDPRAYLRRLRSSLEATRPATMVAPILQSADLERTSTFYQGYGMEEVTRSEGYLIMRFLGVELHFSQREGSATAGEAFVMVPEAGRLWKRYRSQNAEGLGQVEDQPHGLREFVVTDPDGNRIRVGSPIPD